LGHFFETHCTKSITMVGRHVSNNFYCHIRPEGLACCWAWPVSDSSVSCVA